MWRADRRLRRGWPTTALLFDRQARAPLTREYQMTGRDRVVQLASLGFDTSIEQMLVTLLTAAAP